MQSYDYASSGAYFLTLCTDQRKKLFWQDVGAICDRPQTQLSAVGCIVENELHKLNTVYPDVKVEQYCIMPNHVHMILLIDHPTGGRSQIAPTISRIVKQFKGSVSKQCGQPIWQRSFYDHVIRTQSSYEEISEYIFNNPANWQKDQLYIP